MNVPSKGITNAVVTEFRDDGGRVFDMAYDCFKNPHYHPAFYRKGTATAVVKDDTGQRHKIKWTKLEVRARAAQNSLRSQIHCISQRAIVS